MGLKKKKNKFLLGPAWCYSRVLPLINRRGFGRRLKAAASAVFLPVKAGGTAGLSPQPHAGTRRALSGSHASRSTGRDGRKEE